MKIDQKHSLEEERAEKVKLIKKINSEFETDIQKLTDQKEKFERKRMVNNENKDVLEQEKQKVIEQQTEFEQRLKEFDANISGFE